MTNETALFQVVRILPETFETFIYLVMIRLMLGRLA